MVQRLVVLLVGALLTLAVVPAPASSRSDQPGGGDALAWSVAAEEESGRDNDDRDDECDDRSGPGGGACDDERRDDCDEGHSGHGGGGDCDDEDRSGRRGGDDDDDDDPVVVGEIPPGSLVIEILDDDDFTPSTLTVDPGQAITFVNLDNDDHTATGAGFDTGVIPEDGGVATIVLDEPGTYAFACLIHPEMTGTIGVRGPDGTVPPPSPGGEPPPADATTVAIANFAFAPTSITVPVGTTVAWTNGDTAPHTVTALDGAFDSGIFDPGGGFSLAFTAPGTYPYQCDLHPAMQGEVIVTGEAGEQPPPAADAGEGGAAAASRPDSAGAEVPDGSRPGSAPSDPAGSLSLLIALLLALQEVLE